MSSYSYADICGPRGGWWMAEKHRGGPHRRNREFGPEGPGGRGGPGFGPRGGFGPGFGPGFGGAGGAGFGGPGGGGPFGGGRGRKRRGDVRIALLMLLAEEPRNGYQLMQTIEERSGGRWRPSPGSVYPALSLLEDEGLVRATTQDSGRTFEITDAGRKHLDAREDQPAPWEAGDEPGAHRFHELRALLPGIAGAAFQVAKAGDQQQWEKAADVLDEARRSLYRILSEEAGDEVDDASEEESDSDDPGTETA
jgi:DNA-binding PadR family transcriptional regulator